jgi:rubrerythrin
MGKVFYLSEIVNFAIEKESESYSLYKNLAGQVSDATCKKLFQELMQQEQQHKDFFSHMLQTVAAEQTPKVQEDEEYQAYMQELIAESRKLAPVSSINLNDLSKALEYAINREKDSILFYNGLKNLVTQAVHRHIDMIINEETRHVIKILEIKNKLVV